jgi:transcriptional regulator NrdR family protein
MNTVWEPEYIRNQTPIKPQYNGYRSPDQTTTFDNTNIQSFATVVMAKQKQKEIDDKRIYAVNINEPTAKTKNSVDTMVNWTQQLQEQLRNKKSRETSASSTNQLIHSSNSNNH